ncbi:HAD-IA family hydrolase [Paenibacillus eucommiae]|uniref:Hydrolase of the HAD superfamily n=1 Tax=Paenibacillus eucommiae TaxID=1355755 RepID=A0ABS4JA02_9BACL|nr:HAD-IA family hydrolase [Paenibacillus eucommiae]MBP1996681.1 putative hydrolase of the HAD superfamily [Paenibacillus eucommiae]
MGFYGKRCSEITTKPELILDVAGVLATNFSPHFWRQLSIESGISFDQLDHYKKGIREDLWSGKVSEEEFWRRLCERIPSLNKDYVQAMLLSYIKPLPAIEEIPKWSKVANIHLLSNHRAEWIDHIINPVRSYVKSMTISSQTGSCKPNPEIYAAASTHLIDTSRVLFIDDQEKNFKEAKILGWHTLLADQEGEWIRKVMTYLRD